MSENIDVLLLSWAIDEHAQTYGPAHSMHKEGACSTSCAGDIATRYDRLVAERAAEKASGKGQEKYSFIDPKFCSHTFAGKFVLPCPRCGAQN